MPEVDGALVQPVGRGRLGLGARRRLGLGLRGRYGWAVVLPNSVKSALVPAWARIPRRTGYVGEFRYGLLTDARRLDTARLPRTVDRFVALAGPRDAPPPTIVPPRLHVTPEAAAGALDAVGLARPQGPLLAVCPGAEYGPAKRWPANHFAALARRRLAQGWAVWLFGSPADAAVTAEVAAAAPGAVDLAGRTGLNQAVALLSLADAVVTNDSGLMHVAAALDRTVVALFGSSSPAMTPPLSDRATVLSLALPCSPCYQRTCPLGHLNCLRGLEPERVERALEPP
jgi:heptosyltransferase-2